MILAAVFIHVPHTEIYFSILQIGPAEKKPGETASLLSCLIFSSLKQQMIPFVKGCRNPLSIEVNSNYSVITSALHVKS